MRLDLRAVVGPLGAAAVIASFASYLYVQADQLDDGQTRVLDAQSAVALALANLPTGTSEAEAAWVSEVLGSAVAERMRHSDHRDRTLYSTFAVPVDSATPVLPPDVKVRLEEAAAKDQLPLMVLRRLGDTVAAARDQGFRVRTDLQFREALTGGFRATGFLWAAALVVLAAFDIAVRRVPVALWISVAGLACLSFAGLAIQAVTGAQTGELLLSRHAWTLAVGVSVGAVAGWALGRLGRIPRGGAAVLCLLAAVPVLILLSRRVLAAFGVLELERDAWISFPVAGVEVQPLEAVKFVVVAMLALSLRNLSAAMQARAAVGARVGAAWPGLAALVITLLVAGGLNDFGTAIVVVPAAGLALVLLATELRPLLLAGAGAAVFGGWIAAHLIPWDAWFLKAKLQGRLLMFQIPWENGYDNLRQTATGLWAVAAGGWWGRPADRLDASHLREAKTDLVYAWFTEAFGVVGAAVVLCAAAAFALGIVGVVGRSRRSPSLAAAIAAPAVVILAQCIVQTAFALGWHPLAGIVFPFLSSGRSSWFSFAAAAAFAVTAALFLEVDAARDRQKLGPTLLTGIVVIVVSLLLWRLVDIGARKSADVSLRPIVSGTADYNARHLPSAWRVVSNPRLTDVMETLPPATVLTADGAIAARGDAAHREYPLGASAAPSIGVWRVDIAPYSSSVEHRVKNPGGPTDRLLGYALVGCEEDPCEAGDRFLSFHPATEGGSTVTEPGTAAFPVSAPSLTPVLHLLRADRAEVDAWQKVQGQSVEPITVSLVSTLQGRIFASALALRSGARHAMGGVVVMDAETGAFLAEVSTPSIDPFAVTPTLIADEDQEEYKHLESLTRHKFPPGSCFKPLVAAAAIAVGKQGLTFTCGPSAPYHLGEKCRGHGNIGMGQAHKVSCNAYFGQLARSLGRDVLASFVHQYPYSGFSLEGEESDLAWSGFGQGRNETTAAELVRYFAAIATDGSVPICHGIVQPPHVPACERRVLVSEAVAATERGFLEANATSVYADELGPIAHRVGGKTGTSEQDIKQNRRVTPPKRERVLTTGGYGASLSGDHTWFAGYVSDGLHTYAIVTVAPRSGGYGRTDAIPLFRIAVEALADERLLR